jgi:hypothetical protein
VLYAKSREYRKEFELFKNFMNDFPKSIALLMMLLALTGPLALWIHPVHAASTDTGTDVWNGGNGNWETASSWSTGNIPSEMDDVQINSGSLTISSSQSIGSLTIGHGAQLTCKSCMLDVPAGDIINSGIIVNNHGNITAEAGDFNNTSGGVINNGPAGVIVVSTGDINNAGSITNGATSTISVQTGDIVNSGSINNCAGGTINLSVGNVTGTAVVQTTSCPLSYMIPFS